MDVNSLEMNLLVTLFVAALVFLLPLADRRICRRLRLNLEGGLSENPNADRLLRLRQRLLAFGLLLYLLIFAWLIFFSRETAGSYRRTSRTPLKRPPAFPAGSRPCSRRALPPPFPRSPSSGRRISPSSGSI